MYLLSRFLQLYLKRSFSSSVDTISHLNRLKIKEIFIRHSKCLNLPKQNKIFGKFLISFKNVKYLRWIIYLLNIPVLLIQIPVLLIQMPRTNIFPDLSWQFFFTFPSNFWYVFVTSSIQFHYISSHVRYIFVTIFVIFSIYIRYQFS